MKNIILPTLFIFAFVVLGNAQDVKEPSDTTENDVIKEAVQDSKKGIKNLLRENLDDESIEIVESIEESLSGLYHGYKIALSIKMSSVNYSIDPKKDRDGGSYVSCAAASNGELCGKYAQSGNYGHNWDSEAGIDWAISATSPYTFFGKSMFGYQIVYDYQEIKLNSMEAGYSQRPGPFPTSNDDARLNSREHQLEENRPAYVEGYYFGWTPVFFAAPLKGENYLLKFGIGAGLAYLDISGYREEGYIKTYDEQTEKEDDYKNKVNKFEFSYRGIVPTVKAEIDFALYSFRFAIGTNQMWVYSSDKLGMLHRGERYISFTYTHSM